MHLGPDKNRFKGYVIGTLVGLGFGLFVDTIDIEKLTERRDKFLTVISAMSMITAALIAAYNEQPFNNPKERQDKIATDQHTGGDAD